MITMLYHCSISPACSVAKNEKIKKFWFLIIAVLYHMLVVITAQQLTMAIMTHGSSYSQSHLVNVKLYINIQDKLLVPWTIVTEIKKKKFCRYFSTLVVPQRLCGVCVILQNIRCSKRESLNFLCHGLGQNYSKSECGMCTESLVNTRQGYHYDIKQASSV